MYAHAHAFSFYGTFESYLVNVGRGCMFKLQPFGSDVNDDLLYADLYDDVKSGKVADPRVKPPLPPKGSNDKPPPKLPPKDKKAT